MDAFTRSIVRVAARTYGWRIALAVFVACGAWFVAGFIVGSAVN